MRYQLHFGFALLALIMLFGCSGHDSPSVTSAARLVIRWPEHSRLIPAASASVRVTLRNERGYESSNVANRPQNGALSVIQFAPIPVGKFTVLAVAYPTAGAAGTPQARGTTDITVEADATASVQVTMASTISKLAITPTAVSLKVDETQTFRAAASDADGAVVLIPTDGITWSVNGAAATIDPITGVLTAIAAGQAQVTATEKESTVAASVIITVTPKLTGKIIFLSTRDGNSEIYRMNPDGTNQQRLTNNPANENEISLSPDGQRILFISDRGENTNNPFHIFSMNVDGTDVQQITNGAEDDWGPIFTPDSTEILFFRTMTSGDEIFIMNADGTNQRRLTTNNVADVLPSMTPDKQWIVFERMVGKNYVLYKMKPDGTGAQAITNSEVDNWYHCLSPDGTTIAYTESNHITSIKLDGTMRKQLTFPTTYKDRRPWYSPNGAYIAYASGINGADDIYIMDADGSNPRRLTTSSSTDHFPVWGP